MTGTGSRLFLNALHYLMHDLTLPIKGASFIPGAGFDPDFLAALGNSWSRFTPSCNSTTSPPPRSVTRWGRRA